MPVYEYSVEDAFRNFSGANPHASWTGGDSVLKRKRKPVFKPGVTLRSPLPRDAKFYAVGSCFAREVEEALMACGQDVLSVPSAEAELDARHGYRNRYNTSAILNEFLWAFGEEVFPTASIVRLQAQAPLCVDTHSHPYLPFVDFDATLERRRLLSSISARIAECDVIFITLGLIEAWYDNETESYINIVPIFSNAGFGSEILTEQPKRFSFRVMSYRENMDNMERLFAVLKKNMRKPFRILVTTSPVPLMSTFSDRDVMVANTFSKSMLRTCAEEWQQMHRETIDYFPSYEMAVNSNPERVWKSDGTHVKPMFAKAIMGHLMDTCFEEAAQQP